MKHIKKENKKYPTFYTKVDIENEIWKPVVSKDGVSEHYVVSNKGRVARILPQWYNHAGYLVAHSSSRCKHYNCYIHRTMAQTFIRPCEKNEVVNHIDGNKSNNDLLNLEVVSKSEDVKHAIRLGLKPGVAGENNPNYKHGKRMKKVGVKSGT